MYNIRVYDITVDGITNNGQAEYSTHSSTGENPVRICRKKILRSCSRSESS